jgi:hypothetical protein
MIDPETAAVCICIVISLSCFLAYVQCMYMCIILFVANLLALLHQFWGLGHI